jgi:hypothetical protein
MAEIIGLITGVIGSCDVIIRLSQALATCISDAKNKPETLERLELEIQNLGAITAALRGFLGSDRVRKCGFGETVPITTSIRKV